MLALMVIEILGVFVAQPPLPQAVHHRMRPLHGFVENRGQWNDVARYVGMAGETVVQVERGAFRVSGPSQHGAEIRFIAENIGPLVEPIGREMLPARFHFLYGHSPGAWKMDVRSFRTVSVGATASGAELLLVWEPEGIHYDVYLPRGETFESLTLRCEGEASLRVDEHGDLLVGTRSGVLRHRRPSAYTVMPDGERHPLAAWFELVERDRFRLVVEKTGRAGAIVIDPGLEWSTFLGGDVPAIVDAHWNEIWDLKERKDGRVVTAGATGRIDFPTTAGSFEEGYLGGQADAFVSEISADGSTLVYSTFIGGGSGDIAAAIGFAGDGGLIVAGRTASSDFPITPGTVFQSGGGIRMFVLRLKACGSALTYSTCLALGFPTPYDIAVTPENEPILIGTAESQSFPTTAGCFDSTYGGSLDGFVMRLSSDASALLYSSFLGGAKSDWPIALALAPDGGIAVTGSTAGGDFPTTAGSFQPGAGFPPSNNAFVMRFGPDFSLKYSTYLGGKTGGDRGTAIDVDSKDRVTMVGWTTSADYPITPGVYQPCCGGNDAVVTRFKPDGSGLVFSTYFGGVGLEQGLACRLDPASNVVFAGSTHSSVTQGFPTTPGAYKPYFTEDNTDGFVAKLSNTGRDLIYSTVIGGSSSEYSFLSLRVGLDLDAAGSATICGVSASSDFPTTPGAFDQEFGPLGNATVSRLDLLPTGVTHFGESTAGCKGPLAAGVRSMPYVGNGDFELRCVGVPAGGPGWLLIGTHAQATPLSISGATVLVSIQHGTILPVIGDLEHECRVPAPLRSTLAAVGAQRYVQFFFPDLCAPAGIAASNALEIVVQP